LHANSQANIHRKTALSGKFTRELAGLGVGLIGGLYRLMRTKRGQGWRMNKRTGARIGARPRLHKRDACYCSGVSPDAIVVP
jgi:hypothetical protein